MRVLLIFPPFSLQSRYGKKVKGVGGHLAPLGLAYLAAVLEKQGHEVKIIDAAAEGYSVRHILMSAFFFRPDFIGITALTACMNAVKRLSRALKRNFPDAKLCIGGPHATIMPEETLRDTKADMVLVGEGEMTLPKILANREKCRGVIYGEKVVNLDSLPFPARHLLPMEKYRALPNNYKRDSHAINIMASRGCPYSCTFCCKGAYGPEYRQRSVENVISEIGHVMKEYKSKEIVFWDDLFGLKKQWVIDFCRELLVRGMDISWSCEMRVNAVDSEMLLWMKRAGCWNIFYGIEAGEQRLLDNVHKGTTLDMIRKAVKATKTAGIEVRGSFMLGLPGETPELARKTIDFAIELEPDYAQFSLCTPFPGTELYKDAEVFGYLHKDYDRYNEWNPVFLPYGYKNAEELKLLQAEAFRRFYMRPRYIMRRIFSMRSLGDIKRNVLGLMMVKRFV